MITRRLTLASLALAATVLAGCGSSPATKPEAAAAAQPPQQYDARGFFTTTTFGLAGSHAWSPDDIVYARKYLASLDWVDGERHRRISPLFHAKNIRVPLLVVQGANDPRMLQESDEIVAAVRANGVPVEYVLFPDEGHGFTKRENRIRASDAYVKFLGEYLK